MGPCHQIVDIIAAHCTVILFNYLHPITKQERFKVCVLGLGTTNFLVVTVVLVWQIPG